MFISERSNKSEKRSCFRSKERAAKAASAMILSAVMVLSSTAMSFAAGPGGSGAPGGSSSSSSSITWSGAATISDNSTYTDKSYSSTTASQNAVLITGSPTLKNPTVTKSGGTSAGDEESFYGINSAVMCKGGGTTTITDAKITTNAAGANGVFSYGGNASTNATSGDGTTVKISDSTITTTGNGSGGIMTTGQGTTIAKDLTITTSGGSSAAIRSDRGGGTVTVDGGTYKTSGTGSPAIYATATINVSNATLTSTASQGVVNEGGNTVILKDCTVNAGNSTLGSQDKFRNGIFLYQSMSGDATEGASVFNMTGGTLNNTYGHVFHVTNTSAAITLNGVTINNSDSEGVLLSVCDDAWSGLSNKATLNAEDQTLKGKILVGSDSTANINLSGTSAWTGSTSGAITSHRNSSTISSSLGTVKVTMSDSALWVLDADCTVSSILGTGKINYNGHKLTVGSTTYSSGSPGVSTITESSDTASDSTDSGSGSGSSESGSTDSGSSESGSESDSASDSTDTADKSVVFKNTSKTFKRSALKKAKKSFSVIKSSGGGKVTYKVMKGTKKYISVSKTGKVTVKKGAKKGTYKVKITVAAGGGYARASKAIVIKVK